MRTEVVGALKSMKGLLSESQNALEKAFERTDP